MLSPSSLCLYAHVAAKFHTVKKLAWKGERGGSNTRAEEEEEEEEEQEEEEEGGDSTSGIEFHNYTFFFFLLFFQGLLEFPKEIKAIFLR